MNAQGRLPELRLQRRVFSILREQTLKGIRFDGNSAASLVKKFFLRQEVIKGTIVPKMPQMPLPKTEQRNWPKKQFLGYPEAPPMGIKQHLLEPTKNAVKYYGADHQRYRTDEIVLVEAANLMNPDHIRHYLLNHTQWKPTSYNYVVDKETGKKKRSSPKLDVESFEKSNLGEIGDMIAEFQVLKHRKGLLEGLLEVQRDDGTVPVGWSGKTVSHRVRHKTVVNLPSPNSGAPYAKEIRGLFLPDEGEVMVGVDASGIQLRLLTHHMKDEVWREAILRGRSEDKTDIHSINRGLLSDIVGHELLRDQAKRFIYALPFGGSASIMSTILECDRATAERALGAFHQKFPGLQELKGRLSTDLALRGYIEGLDGRRSTFRDEHTAVANLLQMDETVIMEAAMVKTHMALAAAGITEARQLIWYHDEWQWSCRPAMAPGLIEMLAGNITWAGEHYGLWMPLAGDGKAGASWAETH